MLTSDQVGAEVYAPLFSHYTDVSNDEGGTTWEAVEREINARFYPTAKDRPPQLMIAVLGDLNAVPGALSSRDDANRDLYAKYVQEITGRLKPILTAPPDVRRRLAVVSGLNGINLNEPSGFSGRAVEPGTQDLLLDRTVHVPMAYYDSADTRTTALVEHPVELIDLFTTLAHQAEIPPPARASDEDLLQPADTHGEHGPEAYMEYGDMLAIRRGDMLLTFRAFFHHAAALDPAVTESLLEDDFKPGKYALHRVADNPMQNNNMFGARKDEGRRMRRHLLRVRQGEAAPGGGTLSTKHLWELRMTETNGYW